MHFGHRWFARQCAALAAGLALLSAQAASAQIFASTLPQARSTAVNGTVTAFANITNASGATATNCRPQLSTSNLAPVTFSYQTTDSNNVPTGTANTAATIANNATQGYVFSVRANAGYSGAVGIEFVCTGQTAPLDNGVNDFVLVAQQTAGADVIPIAITPSSDGVMRVSTVGGTQAMAAAAVNIGPTTTLTVTPNILGGQMPVSLFVVETTSTGTLIGSPVASLSLSFAQNVPRYFTVLAAADARAGIPFAPDTVRVVLAFTDATNALRGKTSVALTAPGPTSPTTAPLGFYNIATRTAGNSNQFATTFGLALVGSPTESIVYGIRRFFPPVQGADLQYNQYVIPYTATFTGGPVNGTMSLSSQHVFHDTNTQELPGTSLGDDGVINLSGTYTAGVGWLAAYSGVTALGTPYSGTSTASYSTLNFQTATIADLAGSWTAYSGSAANPGEANVGTVNVSAAGVLSGTVAGTCAVKGQLTTPASGPAILLSSNFGITGCPNAFNAAKTYVYKMGNTTPVNNALTPTGDYYAVLFWNLPDNGNTIYLRRN